MARRGDVLRAKRALGFARSSDEERFVVLQATQLNPILPTALVAPLDARLPLYANTPLAIPVSKKEAGTRSEQVILIASVTCAPWTAFQPGAVGRLDPTTLTRVESALKLVLNLP